MTRRWGRVLAAALGSAIAAGGCGSPVAPPSESASSATTASATTASATTSSASASSSAASPGPRTFAHIYLLLLENHEYNTIVGSDDAPYLNSLFGRYGLATQMHAVAHPSEPNYIALVSGGTQGVRDDGVYNLDAPNLFDQIEAAGRTWHVYAQGFPGACSGAAKTDEVADGPGKAGDYARKHNPAISFTAISGSPSRCANITGLAGFDPGAADFEMIVPNQINDMHSASVRTGDAFLAAFLPSILDSAAFAQGSLLIVTFDEGTSSIGEGGHIATLLATPGMAPGTRFDADANHYAVLRTIEDAWGMPPLGAAADAAAIPVTP
jgi:phosphatidylinositol-3-phosphatase